VEYEGFTIKAAAFAVAGTGRFITSLVICRAGSADGSLIDLPVTHGLFYTAEELIESPSHIGGLLCAIGG